MSRTGVRSASFLGHRMMESGRSFMHLGERPHGFDSVRTTSEYYGRGEAQVAPIYGRAHEGHGEGEGPGTGTLCAAVLSISLTLVVDDEGTQQVRM